MANLPISSQAYGYDPTWFTGKQIPTQGEYLQMARGSWRAKNPGAPYMPSDADLGFPYASLEDLFPGQSMTPEGSQAYADLVDKIGRKDQLNSVLTTAGLAALPFAASAFMAPAAGAAEAGAAAGVDASLTAPLSTAGSDLAATEIGLGSIPGLGEIGAAEAGGIGTIGAEGATSVSRMAAPTIEKFAEPAALDFSSAPGLKPTLQQMMTNGALKGGLTGGIKGLITGENPLKTAVKGAAVGGLGGGIGYGINTINPGGVGMINNAATGATTSAISGGNPLIGAISGLMKTNLNTGNSLWDSGIGQGVLGGLAGLYLGNRAGNDIGNQISSLQGLYSAGSPYETMLRKQLERRDAAAGRRSQYGPREVELQAALAGQASKLAPLTAQLSNQRTSNRNLMASTLLMNPAFNKLIGSGVDSLSNLFKSPDPTPDPFTFEDDGGWV